MWTPPKDVTLEEAQKFPGADKYEEELKKLFDGEKDQVRASHLLIKHKDSRRPSSWKEVWLERLRSDIVSHICFFQADITRSKEEAIEILEKYKEEINQAENKAETFARLASEHSDCSSHSNGGDLGWFGRGQMQPAFEEASYKLEPGNVSDIVSTDSGVHIIFRVL